MKLKTLIIDDHPASISILKNMLGDFCECYIATNGHKGIEIFEDAQKSGEPFHVVLLDIIMPDLDGIETLKRIRKIELSNQEVQLFEKKKKLTRIIMQTSSEDPKDFIASYMDGRCNGFINKPYSKDDIIEKILGKTNLAALTHLDGTEPDHTN